MISRRLGEGPDLALIHGWGLNSAVWEPTLAPLEKRCRVHLVDLPGYADAPGNAGDFTQAAHALLDILPAGITLCGWSLGALLALRAAWLAPQHVRGLILVGGSPSFIQRADWPQAQAPALLDTFAEALAEDAASTLQRFVALLNQGDQQARPIGRAMLKRLLAANLPDTATLRTGLDWLRAVDLRTQVAAIATPTLLIHGANDPLMPLPAAQWLAGRLPQARLEVFPGAAHAPFLADPERFAALVGAFCHAPAAG